MKHSGLKCFLLLILLLSGKPGFSQEFLSLEEAIRRGLEYNFDIRLLDNSLQQAQANNTFGNAGFLPTVSLATSYTVFRSNTKLQLSNGNVQETPNALNTTLSGDQLINWTIFDGGRMFYVKRRLNENEFIAKDQFQLQVQQSVSRIIRNYARSVLLKQQLVAIDTALSLAYTRVIISKVKFESGASAKTDYLQASVDYRKRKTDSAYATLNLINSFDSLNLLMGVKEEVYYIVEDSLAINLNLAKAPIETLPETNAELSIYQRNIEVAKLDKRIAQSQRLPTIDLSGGYRYTKNTSATGFALFNRAYGPTGTIGLRLPIFDGGNINRQVKVAGLEQFRQSILYERQLTTINRNYRIAWRTYVSARDVFFLQKENLVFAKENVEVQKARFRVGIGTTLESREAENDYLEALIDYYTSEYNMIVNQTLLLELQNKLVK